MKLDLCFTKNDLGIDQVHEIIKNFFYLESEDCENALIITHELLINSYRLSNPHQDMIINLESYTDRYDILLYDKIGGIDEVKINDMNECGLDEDGRGLGMVLILADEFQTSKESGWSKYFARIRRG